LPTNGRKFDAQAFLATIGEGRKAMLFPKKQIIFTQGDPADEVFYLQTGKVRLTVISETGKQATIGILSDGSFFCEGFTCRPISPHWHCNRNGGLRGSAN
jgi:CRP/FNR family cyclic AMP-dependent transcriptional regulator